MPRRDAFGRRSICLQESGICLHGENSAWRTHLIAPPSRARNSHRRLRQFQIHHNQSGGRSCCCRWFRLLIPDVILFTLKSARVRYTSRSRTGFTLHAAVHRQDNLSDHRRRIDRRLDLVTCRDVKVVYSETLATRPARFTVVIFFDDANALAPNQKCQQYQAGRQREHHPQHYSLNCRHQRPHALTFFCGATLGRPLTRT